MVLNVSVHQVLNAHAFADDAAAEDLRRHLAGRYEQVLREHLPVAVISVSVCLTEMDQPELTIAASADTDLEARLDRALYQISQYARDLVLYTQHQVTPLFQSH